MKEPQAIHTNVKTVSLKKDMQTKFVCLKTDKLLLLVKGQINFLETHKQYQLCRPMGVGSAVFIPKGVKHGVYPFTDCVIQEIIW